MSAAPPARARVVRLDAVAPQPWRNGGGLTRELLAWPEGGDWRVRVSVADVGRDGPFSAFPGVERWFAVLEGDGVTLVVDGRAHALHAGDAPLRFDGAADTHCRLAGGPTRDLNLMLRGLAGGMLPAAPGMPWTPPQGAWCGLFATSDGRCDGVAVSGGTLFWFEEAPAALRFDPARPDEAGAGWWLFARDVGAPGEVNR